MRCQGQYQLAWAKCKSLDPSATLKFEIGEEVCYCCPACANLLEDRLRTDGVKFFMSAIGEES